MTPNATTQTEALLLTETKAGVATLTLNRPGQFNALSTALIDELRDAGREHRRVLLHPSVALGRAVGRKHAIEMLLTGETISAERAGEIGLVKRVVSPETLDVEVETLARCIASKSSAVITSGKQIFYRQLELPLGDAYGLAGHAIACDFFTDDGKEGVDAFLGKRAPRWTNRQ